MGIVTGAVAAYLIGCVPTARVARRLAAGRSWESWAAVGADALKGFVAVTLLAPLSLLGQALTVTAVVAGDQWPAFGREVGRSGLAVGVAALTALSPVSLAAWALCWGVGFVSSGYFTVGRLLGSLLLPVGVGVLAGWPVGLAAVPASILVLERQRPMLRRLLRGEEPKHHWRTEP